MAWVASVWRKTLSLRARYLSRRLKSSFIGSRTPVSLLAVMTERRTLALGVVFKIEDNVESTNLRSIIPCLPTGTKKQGEP